MGLYHISEVKQLSRIQLFATPWTVAYQVPPSMEFSGQEYWSGLPFPSPGDLPDPGIETGSPELQADTLPSESQKELTNQRLCACLNFTVQFSRSVVSDSLRPHGLQPTRFHHPWDFPGKNTGVGCHFLLQEVFPTHRLNPGLPHGWHYRQTLYHLSHQGRFSQYLKI